MVENVVRRLERGFPQGTEMVTVAETSWAGKLPRLARESFDAFLATNKGIPHHQNISGLDPTIVLLRANSVSRKGSIFTSWYGYMGVEACNFEICRCRVRRLI